MGTEDKRKRTLHESGPAKRFGSTEAARASGSFGMYCQAPMASTGALSVAAGPDVRSTSVQPARYAGLADRAGFSLLELTTALFILSAGVFGIIHLHMRGLDKLRAISEYDTALCALNNELETLRALPFEALANGEGLPFRSETPELARLHNAEAAVRIKDATDGPPVLKHVTARVQWTGEHGRRIEKRLATLVTAREYGHETP